ncbi:MAG: beta-agarase, partial [Calditrichaeota bacterium]
MKNKSALKITGIQIILFGLLVFGIYSCAPKSQSDPFWDGQNQQMVLDFEGEAVPATVKGINAKMELVSGKGVTQGTQALKLSFPGDHTEAGIMIKPETPIDASQFKHFCLVFDATNITDDGSSMQVFVVAKNEKGHSVRRSTVMPIGKTKTFYFELSGEYANKETGLRDDPIPWDNQSTQMRINGLKAKIDYSKIAAIKFYVSHIVSDRTVIIDNFRLVESPPIAEDYLVGIIDKYGQAAKNDFKDKITSDEQLKALADAELKQLADEGTMAGRSKFGGWADGPKLEGTGYFRAEKVDGRWALVDPEGYLFFSTGLANVRMANTTSFTGIDFKNDKVRYRDPEDVTPEDSRGMVKLDEDVTSTAYNAYPDRNKMFLGLPSY